MRGTNSCTRENRTRNSFSSPLSHPLVLTLYCHLHTNLHCLACPSTNRPRNFRQGRKIYFSPGCYAPDKREITVLVSDLRPLSLGPRSSNGGGISPFYRKFHENPFVPIGCGLTTLALCYGLYGFSRGRHGSSQKMMRLRVAAQGFTVVALMMGIAKTSMHAASD
ncbi:HIG1 domain family member 2A, mitochondrial [Chionoecetes opilio]|uniref:HIG1 domain family member 2A, mitochondrial n=1 Tax=Chionoecetes opilio TaxID=41210 RepID=A0A8J5CQ83_CHIOP|nr:HIG1 domain family member 2A, mitochondrial [Chionoecetes opilio]